MDTRKKAVQQKTLEKREQGSDLFDSPSDPFS